MGARRPKRPPEPKKNGGKRPGAGRKPIAGESYEHARRRNQIALADKHQLDVERARGKLVEADKVRLEWEDVLREVQSGILAVPSLLRERLPHLSATDVAAIDEEIRRALTALGTNGARRAA